MIFDENISENFMVELDEEPGEDELERKSRKCLVCAGRSYLFLWEW